MLTQCTPLPIKYILLCNPMHVVLVLVSLVHDHWRNPLS